MKLYCMRSDILLLCLPGVKLFYILPGLSYGYIAILLKGHLSCIRIVDNQIVDFMTLISSYMYTYT